MCTKRQNKIAVVGGGAAGLVAAGRAAEAGADVTLFEKMPKVGKKLSITGKGRCNITNLCEINEFLENVPTNPRFLYSALNAFTPADCVSFIESLGVPTKLERGNRVFPCSDRAADVVAALAKYASGAKILHEKVCSIIIDNSAVKGLRTASGDRSFDKVILCTGGKSYPLTGSDGDGYKMAKEAGHTVTALRPSLVPLETEERYPAQMQGLSLKNTALRVCEKESGKEVYSDFGEMMFTHFGVTGPMILSASSHIRDISRGKYVLHIDMKPALDEKTLDKRLLSDFGKNLNKDFGNSLSALLPSKAIPVMIRRSGIDPHKKINSLTKDERAAFLETIKDFTLTIKGTRPIDEAIITSGGVSVKEIDPKTMRSKLIDGLYFAGEIIDVDAYTGGFNLQIAFATARLAAVDAAQI